MKRAKILAWSLLAASLPTTAPALALDASKSVPWQSLPSGTMSQIPAKAATPRAIPAGQRANGVWVVRRGQEEGRFFATVAGSQKDARELTGGGVDSSEGPSVCISTSAINTRNAAAARDWPSFMESLADMQWQARQGVDEPRVTAVHIERLVPNPAGATLEYVDAWADPVTLGSRLIRTGSMALTQMATGPAGVTVYGGRSGTSVVYVVRGGEPPKGAEAFRSEVDRLQAEIPGDIGNGQSSCGFIRTVLDTSSGDAQMATVSTDVVFLDLDTSPPAPQDGRSLVPNNHLGPAIQIIGPLAADRNRTLRTRPLLVNLSASQTSADTAPVVSVSLGWGSRETTHRF